MNFNELKDCIRSLVHKDCLLVSTNTCEIVELFESSCTLFVNRGKVKVVKEG